MNVLKKHWNKVALWTILLLTGFLTIWGIWDEGYGNEFYAACIKSMIQSWHNFFFVSFDPGGFVTVDKPPVALWVQALFAKVLGFSGISIILPEALAAVGAVALIYIIVKRHFGEVAGLISALALGLSPIFIAVSKTNNMDSILIFFMVLATWAMMKAADRGKLSYLILSVVIMGIAYNTKTLQAFLILPALYAGYFFATNIKWKKRVWHLAVATVVLAAVSLSWSIIVDLTPASQRPYVDNSTTNSELELALGYNGIQRLTGQQSVGGAGNGGGAPTMPSGNSQNGQNFGRPSKDGQQNTTQSSTSSGSAATAGDSGNGTQPNNNSGMGQPPSMPGGSGTNGTTPSGGNHNQGGMGNNGGGMFNTGSKGVFRMFQENLGGQDSWLLSFALLTILALAIKMRKKEGEDADSRRKLLLNIIVWGGSVITMCIWFSVAGFFHQYYLATIAPFIAALIGIGVTEMWKMYKEDGITSFMLPFSLAVTAAVQIVMLSYWPAWAVVLIPVVAVLAGIPSVILFGAKLMHKELPAKAAGILTAAIITGLFITPAVWSYSPIQYGSNTSLPVAGPDLTSSGKGMGGGSIPNGFSDHDRQDRSNSSSSFSSKFSDSGADRAKDSKRSNVSFGTKPESSTNLINFLVKNNTSEKYLIAVPDSSTAQSIILATGKPVMSIGGFSGNDNILTVESLSKMVKNGEIKYFMVGGGKSAGSSSDAVTTWVKEHGTVVSSSLWSDSAASETTTTDSSSSASSSDASGGFGRMFGNTQTLYDLSSYKSK